MSKAIVVEATASLCGRLIAHIPEEDDIDMRRGWGLSSAEAIMISYKLYKPSFIVMNNDEPMCLFGCNHEGVLWMMRSENISDISIQFIRGSKKYFDEWLNKYRYLRCDFWGGNKKLRRFMEWSGFRSTDLESGYVRCEKWVQE